MKQLFQNNNNQRLAKISLFPEQGFVSESRLKDYKKKKIRLIQAYEIGGAKSADLGGDVCAAEGFVCVCDWKHGEEADGSAESSVYDASVKRVLAQW